MAPTSRVIGRWLVVAALGASAGCASDPAPSIAPERYEGPAIAADASESQHVLVLAAPSPGWSWEVDRAEAQLARRDLFVTIRRPDPAVMYPQVIVEKRLGTMVDPGTPIAVYARVVGHDDRDPPVAYRFVLRTDRPGDGSPP